MKQERLNSRFLKVLPMSAEESGNGGRNLNIAYSFTETPFGEILPTESTEMNFSKRRLMLSCL